MTVPFSERYGCEPSRQMIVEDAPDRLRTAYIELILNDYTFVDRDSRYLNFEKPLGAKWLYERLTAALLVERDDDYTDSWQCVDILHHLVRKQVPWQEFYDIVEFVGLELVEKGMVFEGKARTYETYRDGVNKLFAKASVVWRLNAKSELEPEIPKELAEGIDDVTAKLTSGFEPSLVHIGKAMKFAFERRSLDSENAIKETISALESFGNTIWPKAKTLGDMVKEMRKTGLPQHLVTVIDKFYAFASDEPAVRHGRSVPSRVAAADAEFCLYVGVALLRYLLMHPATSVDKC